MTLTFKAAETPTLELEHKVEGTVKAAPPGVETTFTARIYLVNAAPDADGDRILAGAVEDGHKVAVSLGEHDVMTSEAEAAGEATLHHAAGAVVALGHTLPTPRGEALRRKLAANAGRQQWSIGYRIIDARGPTRAEVAAHPDLKRIIVKWNPIEISPVAMGACGPACRTLTAEGAAKRLTCGGPCCADETREAVLKELARFEHTRSKWIFSDAKRRLDEIDADRVALETNELRPAEVPDDVRRAAEEAVVRAAEVLGAAPPAIKWYSYDAALKIGAAGMAWKGEKAIWLAAGRDPEDTHRTALHEVAHVKGLDERAAKHFGDALSLLRHTELHVGSRKHFEPRREWRKPDVGWVPPYLSPPSPRLELVEGLPAGALVVDNGVVFERIMTDEDAGWRRIASLIPA